MSLRAEGLSHQFSDGTWGLEDVNLEFGSGQFIVLAGPNGAGKTLLMRHLVGLVRPTQGHVFFQGRKIAGQLAEVRRQVGLVFQDSSSQLVGLTIREEVTFGPGNQGWSNAEIECRVDNALQQVGLQGREDSLCSQLSGGEKKRLALASILACTPGYILLDEPFTGLDLSGVQAVLRILIDLHRRGCTVVVLTHELDKCLAHAERLVLFANHRVLADGHPQDLWERIPQANVHRPTGDSTRWTEMTWLV